MAYRGFAIEVEYYKENEKVVESIARGVLEDIVTETSMESINFYKLPVGMKITRLS